MSASEERTEEATPRRRAQSQAQGITAHSAFANSALVLLAAAATISIVPQAAVAWQRAFYIAAGAAPSFAHVSNAGILMSIALMILRASSVAVMVFWAGSATAAVVAALSCGSLVFAPAAINLSAAKIFARTGLRRLVNIENVIQTAGAAVAAGCLALLLIPLLLQQIVRLAQSPDLATQAAQAMHACTSIWWRAVTAVGVVAFIDVIVQRRKYAVRIKMSPRELREERAQTEGRPETKQRRRTTGLRRARSLRSDAIRRATAVIANPTHVAVALRYAPPLIDIPTVVARGADLMAPVVRAIARAYDVPIIESPELARTLYHQVDIDEPIPEECYAAVAAIFTWIMRTRGSLRRGDEDQM